MTTSSAHSEPLSLSDGNSKATQHGDPMDPLSETNDKPVPAFADESKQHEALHRKVMEQQKFVVSGKQSGAYVSPSDNILSPASAKLNAFKEKRFAKSAKPKTLFGKPSSSSNLSSGMNVSENTYQSKQNNG